MNLVMIGELLDAGACQSHLGPVAIALGVKRPSYTQLLHMSGVGKLRLKGVSEPSRDKKRKKDKKKKKREKERRDKHKRRKRSDKDECVPFP